MGRSGLAAQAEVARQSDVSGIGLGTGLGASDAVVGMPRLRQAVTALGAGRYAALRRQPQASSASPKPSSAQVAGSGTTPAVGANSTT